MPQPARPHHRAPSLSPSIIHAPNRRPGPAAPRSDSRTHPCPSRFAVGIPDLYTLPNEPRTRSRPAVHLGDVPAPYLIRGLGDELGLDRGVIGGLLAPLPALPRRAQYPVERGLRPEVVPSSSKIARTSAGARSANRSSYSTSRMTWRSSGLSARGWRQLSDRRVDHGIDVGSVSALSESF